MFDIREFRAQMARAGITQKQLAQMIGMSEQTLIRRMRSGEFSVSEVERITAALQCDTPMHIFFAKDVACKATNKSLLSSIGNL